MSATEGFAHPEFLIATDELQHRLGDPELRVFDCTIHLIPNPDIGYTVKPVSYTHLTLPTILLV